MCNYFFLLVNILRFSFSLSYTGPKITFIKLINGYQVSPLSRVLPENPINCSPSIPPMKHLLLFHFLIMSIYFHSSHTHFKCTADMSYLLYLVRVCLLHPQDYTWTYVYTLLHLLADWTHTSLKNSMKYILADWTRTSLKKFHEVYIGRLNPH